MLHRLAIGLVLAAVSAPAVAVEMISTVQPPPFGLPYCIKGDKLVCDYVLFDTDGTSGGTLPLYRVGEQVPAMSSVELRSVPAGSGLSGGRVYILVFNYASPEDLPGRTD
jgi:hypothetical protein